MNSWISNWKKIGIKIKKIIKKSQNLGQKTEWLNCPKCKKISYLPDLISNNYICECLHHFDLPPKDRIKILLGENYEIIDAPNINPDPLNFEGMGEKYIDKINKYKKNTGQKTALLCSHGKINDLTAVVVCFNPKFGGGSFGLNESEHFLAAANFAISNKVDLFLTIYQSGGIAVPTNMFGLMGMPKSILAMNEVKKENILTIAVAGRAVTGGVYASSFFKHDIIIIESQGTENLLFAGKRVSASYQGGEKMSEDFGTGQGVIKNGLADIMLSNRNELKETVNKLASIILKKGDLIEQQHHKTENADTSISEDLQKTSKAI